jgi:hypothetical protein
LRTARGVIRRAVVHDQHGRKPFAYRRNQRRNVGGLIETRNHRRAVCRFKHNGSLKFIPEEIEAKLSALNSFRQKPRKFLTRPG